MENRPGNTFALSRRIGSTTYIATVHFSESDTESYEDKIIRMIRREVLDTSGAYGPTADERSSDQKYQSCSRLRGTAQHDTIGAPLMSRQSERSA